MGELTRRSLLTGAAGLGVGAALAGCGRAQTASSPDRLQIWGGVPPASGPQAVADGFQERNPGVTAAYTRFVNDDRGNLKLDTALQGGVEIDVYFTYTPSSMALRAGSGMALDLTDRVRADPELAPFLDREQPRAAWVDDRIVALATAKEPNFVLINEDLRRTSGVGLPAEWTVEEFVEAATRLGEPGVRYGAYTVPDLARIVLGPNYWYAGDGGSNFDHPAFTRHLALGQELINSHVVYPWTEVLARQLEAYQQNPFLKGEFALWPTAPYNLRYLYDDEEYPHDFRVAAAPVPTVAANDPAGAGDWNTGQFSNFIMINPQTTKPDLAWEFVKHWLTAGASPMLAGGKIPALDLVEDDQILAGLLGETPEKYFDVDSFRQVLFGREPKLIVDTELAAVPEISLAVKQQRDLCWIGEKAPERAMGDLHRLADAAIRRDREG